MSTNGEKSKRFSAGDVVMDCEPWIWSFSWEMHKKVCAHCFTLSDRLQVCSQCKLYNYCDANCQKLDWKKEHKVECDMLKNLNGFFTQAEIKERKTRRADVTADPSFGLWTLEIILLKIINKIQRNVKDDFPDFGGKLTAVEILQKLPYVAEKGKTIKPYPGLFRTMHDFNAACLGIAPNELAISVKDMLDYYRKAHYNACRIINFNAEMTTPFGAGIFPTSNHRELTTVCSDSNVTLTFHGRHLRVHAIDDIPVFNGIKDCRWYGLLMRRPLGRTLKQRRDLYHKETGQACTCRKCTDEYDADVNPLKCITSCCTERIPSDNRALEACPQCGAINADNLQKFRKLVAKQEKVLAEKLGKKIEDFQDIIPVKIHLLKELDEAGLVHPEAHLRYIYGWDAADRYLKQRDFESAWNLYDVLVPCVRKVFPKYHLQRAQHLQMAGIQCHVYFTAMSMCAHPNDRAKFLSIFADILPKAVDWLKESLNIYVKLYGQEGIMVEAVRENLLKTEQALRLLKSEMAVREKDPERFSAVSEVVYKNFDFPAETAANIQGPRFDERLPNPSDIGTVHDIFQGLIPNTSVDWNEMAGLVVSEDSVTTVRYLSTHDGYYTVRGKNGDRGMYWNEEPDDWDARPFCFATMIVLDREKKCVRDLMGVLEEKFGWAREVNENRAKFADLFEGKSGNVGWLMCELVNTNPVISATLYDELKDNIDKAVTELKPFSVDRHLLIVKAHLPVGGTMKDVQYANKLEELWYKNAQATFCFEAGSSRDYLSRKMQGKKLVPIRIVMLLDAGRMYTMIKDLTTSCGDPPRNDPGA